MKNLIALLIVFLLITAFVGPKAKPSVSTTENANVYTTLQQDLDTLLAWFPEEYDNHQQAYKEAVRKLPREKRHRQTHHIFHEVKLNFVPGRTLYAQQSQHYNLDDLYRQRIYSFEIDHTEQAIRLRIYTPKEPAKLTNGHKKPEIFKRLSENDFFLKPGCDVFWNREGDVFRGYLKENACNYYSDRFGKQVYLNETLILRKDALLLEDTATDIDGNPVFGVHDKGPTINLKEQPCN